MYCIKCGKPIPDGDRFCRYCGQPVFPVYIQQPHPGFASVPPNPVRMKKPAAKRKKHALAWVIVILVLVLAIAVIIGTKPNQPTQSGLQLGQFATVARQSIARDGGTVTVSKEGSAIDGMTISVPSGCYSDAVNFTVSEADVKASSLPAEFKILSPLIKVNNGGAASASMMEVKIPCKMPKDGIPLAFYCDEKTGALEALPVLASNENSITVGVRHFSDIIAGSVSKYNAESGDNFDTHFRPGIDDFHITNYGSSLCPKGFCGGQSIATIWYYTYRTLKGDDQLWNRYDNYGKNATFTFKSRDYQEDDVMALRLASVVQKEATWGSDLSNQFLKACQNSAEQTFYGIIYAMKLTKMPQLIDIASSDGTAEHAIIAYRSEGKKIYVADPNYPGQQDRFIEFFGGNFLPYSSARTRDEADQGNSIQFTRFALIGFTAMFDPPKLQKVWAELENRTIGETYFPEIPVSIYTKIKTPDGEKEVEITDGFEAATADLKITRDSFLDYPYGRAYRVTDGKGTVSKQINVNPDGTYNIPLKKGDNYIGIGIFKRYGSSWRWYDFKWVKVTFNESQKYKFKVDLSNSNVESRVNISWSGELAINSDGTVTAEVPGGISTSTRYSVDDKYVGTYAVSVQFGVKISGTWKTESDGLTLRIQQKLTGYQVQPITVTDGHIDQATLANCQEVADQVVPSWLEEVLTDQEFTKVDSTSSFDLTVNGWIGTFTISPVQ